MKRKLLLLLLLCMFSVLACHKLPEPQEGASTSVPKDPSFGDLNVPSDFEWTVHQSVGVSVVVADQYNGAETYRVDIYDGEDKLGSGYVKGLEILNIDIKAKATSKYLTIVQVDPNGDKSARGVIITGGRVDLNYNTILDNPNLDTPGTTRSMVGNGTAITVPEGAVVPSLTKPVFEAGGSYIIEDYTIGVQKIIGTDDKPINIYVKPGGIFRIDPISVLTNVNIYIIAGGRLVGTSPEAPFTNVRLENYGEVNIYGGYVFDGGEFLNYNETFLFDLTMNNSKLVSDGLLLVGPVPGQNKDDVYVSFPHKEPELGVNNELGVQVETNTGLVEFNKTTVTVGANGLLRSMNLNINGGSLMLGTPHAWVSVLESLKFENKVNISVYNDTSVPHAKIDVVVEAHSMTIDNPKEVNKDNDAGNILFDIVGDADDLSPNGNKGKVQEGLNKPGVLYNPMASTIMITNSYYNILKYNDGGYRYKRGGYTEEDPGPTPTPTPDPDPDDIPKLEYLKPAYTILMEDGYPAINDMDMNDIVCEWQLGLHLTGGEGEEYDNKVKRMALRYTVRALGGTRHISAAVALPGLNALDIKEISYSADHNPNETNVFEIGGNKLEEGQNEVVIPLLGDAHATCFEIQPKITNTSAGVVMLNDYTFEVFIDFYEPILQSQISRDEIDFFIIVDMAKSVKRDEIHLYGNTATSLASNKDEDFSSKGTIWGVEATENFTYPSENINIIDAFKQFAPWVQSSGTENKNWYKFGEEGKVIKRKPIVFPDVAK